MNLLVEEWAPIDFSCVWLNSDQCLDVDEGVGPAEHTEGILLKWIILFDWKLMWRNGSALILQNNL